MPRSAGRGSRSPCLGRGNEAHVQGSFRPPAYRLGIGSRGLPEGVIDMRKKMKIAAASVGAAAVLTGGALAATAGTDSEGGVTGAQADRAKAAALEATGGGTVGAVERDGEAGATWEVEVRTTDGRTVDVRLAEDFSVVTIDGDIEKPDTGDGSA